jgi:hypothetical protein
MTTQLDSSIGIKKETTYGTAVVVDHFPEFLSEKMKWKPNYLDGKGLRPGSRVSRAERRSLSKNWVEGEIELECCARGFGIFWEALLGTGTSTIISGGPGYQQVFSLLNTDPFPSYTIQKGIPLLNGGAVQAHTFAGAQCTKGEITAETGEVVKLKSEWIAKSIDTTTGYTAPSYVAANELFTFWQGAITIGGVVVVPTTTALASGGTSQANIRNFSLSIDNKLDQDGFTFGSGGKFGRRPHLGYTEIKGKMTAEFDSTTYRDAFLNNTNLAVTLTMTTGTLLQTSTYNTLQIVLPTIRLDGDIPEAVNEGVVTLELDFTVLDGGSAGVSPVYIVQRSLDTAI